MQTPPSETTVLTEEKRKEREKALINELNETVTELPWMEEVLLCGEPESTEAGCQPGQELLQKRLKECQERQEAYKQNQEAHQNRREGYGRLGAELMREFRQSAAGKDPEILFYLACGADVVHPFLLFPSLTTTIGFACEDFGSVLDLENDRNEGRLPKTWPINGQSHLEEKNIEPEEGWDDVAYYGSQRDNKVCADILLRIKHCLGGIIKEVKKYPCYDEVCFEVNDVPKSFIYMKAMVDGNNFNRYRDIFNTLFEGRGSPDILFLKGCHSLLETNRYFKELALCHLGKPEQLILSTATVEKKLASYYDYEDITETEHEKNKRLLFLDTGKVNKIKTGVPLGYDNLMYIGRGDNLDKIEFITRSDSAIRLQPAYYNYQRRREEDINSDERADEPEVTTASQEVPRAG